jgi:hypothetical protein
MSEGWKVGEGQHRMEGGTSSDGIGGLGGKGGTSREGIDGNARREAGREGGWTAGFPLRGREVAKTRD